MSDVVISVRGEHETRVPAELGVATVSVRLDGPDRAAVFAQASTLAERLVAELADAQQRGTVAQWSSERVSVWSDRPWSQDGTQLPLVHHAAMSTRSEFTDFAALSEWITAVSEREGVAVDGISWELTPATARTTESEVAQAAVGVAMQRATAYAAALGLSSVRPSEIADAGLLKSAEAAMGKQAVAMRAFADSAGGGGGLQLEPRPIRVAATVEARFLAS